MEKERKLKLLEEAMEMEEGTLEAGLVLADIDEYNSMAKLALIVLMNDEFEKKLDNQQIKSFVTVQDILDYMD